VFPDYSLPDHTGTARTLSEPQGRDSATLRAAVVSTVTLRRFRS
jgi:hypothetical protein